MSLAAHSLPRDLEALHTLITTLLGSSFSYDDLLDALSTLRGNKHIRVDYGPLDGGTLGYCVDLRDCILVMIRKRLGETLDMSTRLHECGHIGLGHLTFVDMTAAQWLHEWNHSPTFRKLLVGHVTCKHEPTVYDAPHEWAAETMGTVWLDCIEAHAAAIPEVANHLYGFRGSKDE